MESFRQEFPSLEMNELHRAVQENRLEAVKCLMKNGVDIANTIQSGQTPLHIAVKNNYSDITLELLNNNSREKMRNVINKRTLNTGTAALHLAARNNSLWSTRFLLSRGANFEIQDYRHRQPKHQTSDERILQLIDRIEMIFESTSTSDSKILLEKLNLCSANNVIAAIYARNSQDFTSLQVAMDKNHLDAVATIVGFRINNLRKGYWKPCSEIDKLMRYSKAARLNLSNLDELCHEDADESMVDADVKKEVVDLLRNTHRFLKAYKERGDIEFDHNPLLVIIDEGLEFFGSYKTSKYIENERVDLMLWKGPAFAAQMMELCIVAPMQLFMKLVYTEELRQAASKNDLALVEKYLTGHPDMNDPSSHCRGHLTPLEHAVKHGNLKMLELLLNFGADPTSPSKRDNRTLLHFISEDPSSDKLCHSLRIVLDHVSSDGINARTSKDRSTALHLAKMESNRWWVHLLLSRGAIYCAKDAHDKTPEDYFGNSTCRYLLKTIDQLFAQARDGQIKEVIQKMRTQDVCTSRVCGGARDEEGHTLDEVLELKGHVDEAKQIREMLSK